MKLFEAFEALEALNEETFTVSNDGIEKLGTFMSEDENIEDTVDVIDTEAETEEELSDSYIGQVILDCSVCHSKIYKDKTEVTIDEEQELANVGEDCPYCYTSDGFKVIGEVAPFAGKVEETDNAKEDEEEEIVEESLTEAVGTLERPLSALGGTLSNVMTAHQGELASISSKAEALAFLDSIEPEVKNKGYLATVKEKVAKLSDFKVLTFLYNIILKGDGMGSKLESLTESYRGDLHRLTAELFDIMSENGFDTDAEDVEDYIFAARDLVFEDLLADPSKSLRDVAEQWFKDTEVNYPEDLKALTRMDYEDLDESKSINEEVNNVNVETDDSIVNVSADENGKVTVTTEPKAAEAEVNDEMIVPVSDETKSDIENNDAQPEEDVDFEEFDEASFDELGESYLKESFDNVVAFRTNDVTMSGDDLIVEGLIKFDSGNVKKTSFTFTAKDFLKEGLYRFVGKNNQLVKSNSFELVGKIKDTKFICESLTEIK